MYTPQNNVWHHLFYFTNFLFLANNNIPKVLPTV